MTAAVAAESFVAGQTLAPYMADTMRRLAVERLLEVLGEVCVRLAKMDPDFVAGRPSIRLAIGLRNRIIHGYDAIDHETVFLTVTEDLPALRAALEERLNQLR